MATEPKRLCFLHPGEEDRADLIHHGQRTQERHSPTLVMPMTAVSVLQVQKIYDRQKQRPHREVAESAARAVEKLGQGIHAQSSALARRPIPWNQRLAAVQQPKKYGLAINVCTHAYLCVQGVLCCR